MSTTCPAVQEPGSSAATERLPFISVILPVRNEGRFIAQVLRQLVRQDYDPARFEILVADGQSTDDTRAIVREFPAHQANLQLLDNPRRLSSAGRNVAVRAARGDIIVLIDGHCELDNARYLRHVAEAFQRSGADCLGRPQPLGVTGATCWQRAIAGGRSSWLGHNPGSYIYTSKEQFVAPQSVAVAYRRWVFDRVGLFDEGFDACEDVEFNHRVDRAGLRCYFTPHIQVRYAPRSSLRGLFWQMTRYGRGRARLLRKHPETFSVSCFLPALFLAWVVGGGLLALGSEPGRLLYGASLVGYLIPVLVMALVIALRKRDYAILFCLPFVFPAIHFGVAVGLWSELGTRLWHRRAGTSFHPSTAQ